MLVVSELYASEYNAAVQDAERFLILFPQSSYTSYVRYHTGRAYFLLSNHTKAVYYLTEFCHAYPNHELYPSALFWLAESFFVRESYDSAEALYTRIVTGYPHNSKQNEALARIEIIQLIKKNNEQLALLRKNNELTLTEKSEYERLSKLEQAWKAQDEAMRTRINEIILTPVPAPAAAIPTETEPAVPIVKEPVLTEQQQFITTLIGINTELDKEKQQLLEYQKVIAELLSKNASQGALRWTITQQQLITGLLSPIGSPVQTKRDKMLSELLVRSADINNRQSGEAEKQKLIIDLQNADKVLSGDLNQVEGQQYLIMQLIASSMGLSEGTNQTAQPNQAAAINQNLSILEKQISDAKTAEDEALLTSDYESLLRKARLLWAYIVEQNQY
jgi:tetratricopeptide (TPR) repeat protein